MFSGDWNNPRDASVMLDAVREVMGDDAANALLRLLNMPIAERVSSEAHANARRIAQGIRDEWTEWPNRVTDPMQYIEETASDQTIDYPRQFLYAWGLPNADDEDLGDYQDVFNELLARKAFLNLRAMLTDMLRDDLEAIEAID